MKMPLYIRFAWLFLPRYWDKEVAAAAKATGLTVSELKRLIQLPERPIRFYRKGALSSYGWTLWIGRVRICSPWTMTPKWPHIYKGGDEFCNDTLCFHIYPLVSIDVWWRWHQRDATDGMCEQCEKELREIGWSDEQIVADNQARISDFAFWQDHVEDMKNPEYREAYEREAREIAEWTPEAQGGPNE